MSKASTSQTINIYKKESDFEKKRYTTSCNLTDNEYRQVFMSQHKFSLKSSYNTEFTCGKFCNLTISANPQIIENRKTIDMIKQIYKDACSQVDNDEVEPYKNLSTSVFSVFLEKVTLGVKKCLLKTMISFLINYIIRLILKLVIRVSKYLLNFKFVMIILWKKTQVLFLLISLRSHMEHILILNHGILLKKVIRSR